MAWTPLLPRCYRRTAPKIGRRCPVASRPVPMRKPTGRSPKHGARALSRHLAAGTLDGRTWVAKQLKDVRLELAADAGGLEHLTARERILIDRCAAAVLIVSSIEAH